MSGTYAHSAYRRGNRLWAHAMTASRLPVALEPQLLALPRILRPSSTRPKP